MQMKQTIQDLSFESTLSALLLEKVEAKVLAAATAATPPPETTYTPNRRKEESKPQTLLKPENFITVTEWSMLEKASAPARLEILLRRYLQLGLRNLTEQTVKKGLAFLLALAAAELSQMPTYEEIYEEVQVFKRSWESVKTDAGPTEVGLLTYPDDPSSLPKALFDRAYKAEDPPMGKDVRAGIWLAHVPMRSTSKLLQKNKKQRLPRPDGQAAVSEQQAGEFQSRMEQAFGRLERLLDQGCGQNAIQDGGRRELQTPGRNSITGGELSIGFALGNPAQAASAATQQTSPGRQSALQLALPPAEQADEEESPPAENDLEDEALFKKLKDRKAGILKKPAAAAAASGQGNLDGCIQKNYASRMYKRAGTWAKQQGFSEQQVVECQREAHREAILLWKKKNGGWEKAKEMEQFGSQDGKQVDVGDLPSEACLVFLEKTLRRKEKAALWRKQWGSHGCVWGRLPSTWRVSVRSGPTKSSADRPRAAEVCPAAAEVCPEAGEVWPEAAEVWPEAAAQKQERSGRKQQRFAQKQERFGRKQQRSGRKQQRSAQKQERSGRKQQRSDRKQERSDGNREARQRQERVFSAKAWASNMDGGRGDTANEPDNPFKRFQHASRLHVQEDKESLRVWPERPVQVEEQPCLLCDGVGFGTREELLSHIDDKHGGLQRYRNAYLHLESLCPHVVVGSEVRHYVGNYAEFLRRSAMDWEASALSYPRERIGCAFCARCFWRESMQECYLKGSKCFMAAADRVWEMVSVKRYHERWPLIPIKELEASSVDVGTFGDPVPVLLHKRRVTAEMTRGDVPAAVCEDCVEAFSGKKPWLCKYALANDLWLGRPDPLLWKANMTHDMCLALARTVATKVVLRAGGASQTENSNRPSHSWDFVFQQSGLVGSAVVFHNGEESRETVSRIARLRLDRNEFLAQAEALQNTNPVYQSGVTEINRSLLAEWCGDQDAVVPPPVLDCVVAVPVGEHGPGVVRQSGPAEATEVAQRARDSSESETCVLAMEPQVQDFNAHGREISMLVVSMLQKLEELQEAGARSVALEMETMVDEQRNLVDELGCQTILDLCRQIHDSCRQLSAAEKQNRLERELRDAVMGKSKWLHVPEADLVRTQAEQEDCQVASGAGPGQPGGAQENGRAVPEADPQHRDAKEEHGQAAHLLVARGKQPLSLWDWKIWTMAKPRLWRYGDAGNLFERDTNLSTSEWAACLLLREELAYVVDGEANDEAEEAQDGRPVLGSQSVQNRFSGDWTALHMMATVSRLTDQRAASYNFLKNGGMAFAKKLGELRAEDLARAARSVKDALQAVNAASATVLGTDGHRRLCRHEGVAYMEAFGPPLIFLTPNVADTQHPLLLVVQGEAVDLGAVSADMETVLPKYRDMLRRLAQDPVGQTVQFELLMRLFFRHVLNVRPDTLDCRRNAPRRGAKADLARMLREEKHVLQRRLRTFMCMTVASFESIAHASVQAAPRIFGDLDAGRAMSISSVARNLCKYDGGCDLDLLKELPDLSEAQRQFLANSSEEDLRRPEMRLEESTGGASSIFSTPINCLSVAQTPGYRLRSCRAHRKGKALRPVVHIGSAAEMDFGSAGKMRPIQLTPFEVQTSYGGTVAGRHNLDVQDMRRVLDPALWQTPSDRLPQIAGPVSQLGYMDKFEWNGTVYDDVHASRHRDVRNSFDPNLIVAITDFRGGQIFVVRDDGDTVVQDNGAAVRGFVLDPHEQPCLLYARKDEHFTLPWEGRRLVLVAFCIDPVDRLDASQKSELLRLMTPAALEGAGCAPPANLGELPSASSHPVAPSQICLEIFASPPCLSQAFRRVGVRTLALHHAPSKDWNVLNMRWDVTQPADVQACLQQVRDGTVAFLFVTVPSVRRTRTRLLEAVKSFLVLTLATLTQCQVSFCFCVPITAPVWRSLETQAVGVTYHVTQLDLCMFGCDRQRRVRLLHNVPALRGLSRQCDGQQRHLPWSPSAPGASDARNLPETFCRDVVQACAALLSGAALPTKLRPASVALQGFTQLSAVPPVVPEYKTVIRASVPADFTPPECIPPRGCAMLPQFPAGAVLLKAGRLESVTAQEIRGRHHVPEPGGEKGHVHSAPCSPDPLGTSGVAYGVPWSVNEFLEQALKADHPCNTLTNALKALLQSEIELRNDEATLHQTLHPEVQRALSGKRLLLFRKLACAAGVEDPTLFQEICDGFRILGYSHPSGQFPVSFKYASMSESELRGASKWVRAMLKAPGPGEAAEVSHELWDEAVSQSQDGSGWLYGPYTESELDAMFPDGWVPSRRFGVKQRDRTRAIDDLRASPVNSLTADKIVLQDIDVVAQTARAFMSALIKDKPKPLDLKSAYKQLASAPCDGWACILAVWDPSSKKYRYFRFATLPFGAVHSVTAFNRVARALRAILLKIVRLVVTSFYDDYCQLEVDELAGSAQATAQIVLQLVGWRIAEDPKKCLPFSQVFAMLGASFSWHRSPEGILEVANKEGRLQTLRTLVDSVCADGFVHPGVLASLKGRFLYASTHTFGRVAMMAVNCLNRHLSGGGVLKLGADEHVLLQHTVDLLEYMRPREVKVSSHDRPVVIFTDGAHEEDEDLTSHGAVLIDPSSRTLLFFGERVPQAFVESRRSSGRKQLVGQAEVLPVITAKEGGFSGSSTTIQPKPP
ncbi:unnamed protein product [Symbiodinium sp. CCMP2592]|nr:unnamed protein product [Symbiodinium sp. CCMP2592]